jgi:hypothetical protein
MLTWIMHDVEKFCGDSGGKQPIHVATRCSNELLRVSTLRHSGHDRRYAASVRSARGPSDSPSISKAAINLPMAVHCCCGRRSVMLACAGPWHQSDCPFLSRPACIHHYTSLVLGLTAGASCPDGVAGLTRRICPDLNRNFCSLSLGEFARIPCEKIYCCLIRRIRLV